VLYLVMDDRTFFREVAASLGCDERRAEGVTFVVFGELRDRLSPAERHDVESQLSTGLKRLWRVGDVGRDANHVRRIEFLGRVRHRAVLADDAEAERAVRAVFACLQRALGSSTGREGEAWDVLSQLPKDLKYLWLDASVRRTMPAASPG
jgi:uncharacterized protein (DUF2267 family)